MPRSADHSRQLISEYLLTVTRFMPAQEIAENMAEEGYSIGLATVYRNLQRMADEDLLDVIQTDTKVLYRLCRTENHHHHLICSICGETVEVEGTMVQRWAKKLQKATGFSRVDHIVEFSGICPACQEKHPEVA